MRGLFHISLWLSHKTPAQKTTLIYNLSKREVWRYSWVLCGYLLGRFSPRFTAGSQCLHSVFGENISSALRVIECQKRPLDLSPSPCLPGLLIFNCFLRVCIRRATNFDQANANYVKKVVFPLESLTPGDLGCQRYSYLAAAYSFLLILMTLSKLGVFLGILFWCRSFFAPFAS